MATTIGNPARAALLAELRDDTELPYSDSVAAQARLVDPTLADYIPPPAEPPKPLPPPQPPPPPEYLKAQEYFAGLNAWLDSLKNQPVPERPPGDPYQSLAVRHVQEMLAEPFTEAAYVRRYIETLHADGEMGDAEREVALDMLHKWEFGEHDEPQPEIRFDNPLVKQIVAQAGDDLELAEELAYELAGAIQGEQWSRRERERIEKELRTPRKAKR